MNSRVKEGDKTPDFHMKTDGSGEISLAALSGRFVVLYFYPKDDTSGGTKQAIAFTLGADEDKAVREAYGVWVENGTYGRKYRGVDRSILLNGWTGSRGQRVAQGQGSRPRR